MKVKDRLVTCSLFVLVYVWVLKAVNPWLSDASTPLSIHSDGGKQGNWIHDIQQRQAILSIKQMT